MKNGTSLANSYPIELTRLDGAPVLIAGAGKKAAQRIEAMLGAGARIHLVAPELDEAMQPFLESFEKIERRNARPEDVLGKRVVIAATNDMETNRELAFVARWHGILVNVVDDPESCDFYVPAVVRRGPVHLAIGTNGSSPLFAAQLRRLLEILLPPALADVGDLFARMRRRGGKGLERKSKMLTALADKSLSKLVDLGRFDDATDRLANILAEREEIFAPGTVAIVGAGPGAKSLLTLRAVDRIERADVILHDALVEHEVLALALPGTRVLRVGRRANEKAEAQSAIEVMISEARAGRRVVRLHGGDPFVFGRGGEELIALEHQGINVELVPGVSSVLAVAAAARVPLTLRGRARGFSVRTGHNTDGPTSAELPKDEETVVVLMGLGNLAEITAGLIEEGRNPESYAVVVSRASTPRERIVRGTLKTIAGVVAASAIDAPATMIVSPI